MRPSFQEISKQITEHTAAVNELKTLAYGIHAVEIAGNRYTFICYYDLNNERMASTLLDKFNNELRLTVDIPIEVFVLFGVFSQAVVAWELGQGLFPTDIPDLYGTSGHKVSVKVQNELVLGNTVPQEVHQDFKLD